MQLDVYNKDNLTRVYQIKKMISMNMPSSYRIEEKMLIVNDVITPYDKQIMRSSDTLFITDLAVEVPITQQLKAYDQFYFHHMIQKQMILELESSHPEVGLEILQQMPNMQIEHYEYILSKISLQKFKKILMHNDFLLYLSQTLRRVTKLPSQSYNQSDRSAIFKLTEPYQRAIFLLSSITESGGTLKDLLEIISKKLIDDIVNQKDFIKKLAFGSNHSDDKEKREKSALCQLNDQFLQKLQEFTIIFHFLQKNTSTQWQIIQYYIDKLERKGKIAQEINRQIQNQVVSESIVNKIFNKKSLNFIGKHFDHFFQYNRRDFLQVLDLILTYNKQQFWDEVISYKEPQQPLQIMVGYSSNQNTLREFMINNYLNKDSHSWSQSLSILEKLNGIKEAESMLNDLYSDLVQYPLKLNVIQLISAFIKITVSSKKKLQIQLKFLLTSFFDSIISSVNQMQADYNKQAKKIQTECKNFLRLIGIPMYPKIKAVLLSAYIRAFSLALSLNLSDHLQSFTFEKSISKILKMQFRKNSLIHGVKVQLIQQVKKNASKIKNADIIEYLQKIS